MVMGLFTLPALIVAGGVVLEHAELTPWALTEARAAVRGEPPASASATY
jgi:hypothetical protein